MLNYIQINYSFREMLVSETAQFTPNAYLKARTRLSLWIQEIKIKNVFKW